jgi:hypothetical protein
LARYGQNDFPRLVERIRARKPDGWTGAVRCAGIYLDGADDQDGRKVLVLYNGRRRHAERDGFADALEMSAGVRRHGPTRSGSSLTRSQTSRFEQRCSFNSWPK